MVQIGSRVDVCCECDQLTVVGEFWIVAPRHRFFKCAPCLRRDADSVEQAASRLPIAEVRLS